MEKSSDHCLMDSKSNSDTLFCNVSQALGIGVTAFGIVTINLYFVKFSSLIDLN
jgi:hypothetical protein